MEETQELKELLKHPVALEYFKKEYLLNSAVFPGDKQVNEAWDRIQKQIEESYIPEYSNVRKIRNYSWFRTVAASVAMFILGALVYYFAFDFNKGIGLVGFSHKIESPEKLTTKIYVPLGSRSKIELPDGTSVHLNAGSMLEYGMDYGADSRNVKLEGEAYFKVAKKDSCLFTVMAKNTSISALGTEFNVKAYREENFVQTTLVEGSVRVDPDVVSQVEDVILKPNQSLTVYKDNAKLTSAGNKPVTTKTKSALTQFEAPRLVDISMKVVNPVLYTSWKDARWVIEGEELESLAQKLQRRYNVNILIASPALKKYKFNAIIEDETLEQVMDLLKNIAPINYFVDKNTVVLGVNPEQSKAFERSMNSK